MSRDVVKVLELRWDGQGVHADDELCGCHLWGTVSSMRRTWWWRYYSKWQDGERIRDRLTLDRRYIVHPGVPRMRRVRDGELPDLRDHVLREARLRAEQIIRDELGDD